MLVGFHTYKALGGLAEIAMACAESKPIVQLIGIRGRGYIRVKGSGKVPAGIQSHLTSCSETSDGSADDNQHHVIGTPMARTLGQASFVAKKAAPTPDCGFGRQL